MLEEGRLLSLEFELPDLRCKSLLRRLAELGLPEVRVLLVSDNELVRLASRNIPWLTCVGPKQLDLIALYPSRVVIFDSAALEVVKARFNLSRSQARLARKRKLNLGRGATNETITSEEVGS